MSTFVAILVFVASLALTLAAAGFFADRLDHIGPRLGLPEPIVGLLTALAADAPEIASAVIALAHGDRNVGLGVVLGSNAFNLAAMIGLSAFVTGAVEVDKGPLLFEAAVGVTVTAVVTALVLGAIDAWVALVLVGGLGTAYLLAGMRGHLHRPHIRRGADRDRLWQPAALIVPAVALIALGALGMVRTALILAGRWHVSPTLVGISVLAVLTSLPNAFTAVRLAQGGRGAALVSETFSSNTINLVGGVILPALVVGLAARSALNEFDLAWVLATTLITVAMLALPGGLRRRSATLLLCLYVAFVAVQVVSR